MFAGLYAASVILMFFIFSAFGVSFSVNGKQPDNQFAGKRTAAENEVIQTDSLLHAGLRMVQLSDERLRLLGDTASALQQIEAAMQVNNNVIALKNALDSIEILSAASAGGGTLSKMMINTFRAALNERQALKNMQSSITTGKTRLSANQQDDMQWRDQLLRKDNEINRLELQLKAMQQSNTGITKASGASEAQQGEVELLKTAFNDQQKVYEALKENFGRVKTENAVLTAKVADMKKNVAIPVAASNTADNRVSELQQKLEAMNADLYFARIDCNMARADAQQIISNARQRKELLIESLGMLNNLAKSSDDGVQKKAKEKIARLNRIANTLHD